MNAQGKKTQEEKLKKMKRWCNDFLKSGKTDIILFKSVTSGGTLQVLNFYTMFLNFF